MISGVAVGDVTGAHVADEMVLHWTFSLCLEATACGLSQCHRLHFHIWLAGVGGQARRVLFILVVLPAVGIVGEVLVASCSA